MHCLPRAVVAAIAALAIGTFHTAPAAAAGPIGQPITTAPGLSATLTTVASGLAFPTDLAFPDTSGRVFVTTLAGQVRLLKNGLLEPTAVLDLSATTTLGEERGMTSLAFHPNFAVADDPGFGKFYVMTSEAPATATADMGAGSHHQCALYEYRVSAANPDIADPASKRQVLRFDQPRGEHRVNDLTFGPDGLLYITSGDGGGTPVQSPNAQDLALHYGKVLRIDVNGSNAANGQYGVPAGNPFVGTAGAMPEVFAYAAQICRTSTAATSSATSSARPTTGTAASSPWTRRAARSASCRWTWAACRWTSTCWGSRRTLPASCSWLAATGR